MSALPFESRVEPIETSVGDAALSVSYTELPERSRLAVVWQDLETRSQPSFFVSWGWIESWLATMPSPEAARLLEVREHGRTIALGIFGLTTLTRHKLLRSRAALLHETGARALDEISIEYNGLLTATGRTDAALSAALNYLAAQPALDEIFFGGIEGQAVTSMRAPPGMNLLITGKSCCHYVALDEIRKHGDSFVPYLFAQPGNKKLRYHIKQALGICQALGPLSIHAAESEAQAQGYLSELKAFHQTHWNGRGLPGAFAGPAFEAFHRRLIARQFKFGEIQLLKISAGDIVIGYFYNFLRHGHLYHYQSGMNYAAIDPKGNPGLVSHCYAIDYNVALGTRVYDFMAGDYHYKRALSNSDTEMFWYTLQRQSPKFALENFLRSLKRRLRKNA